MHFVVLWLKKGAWIDVLVYVFVQPFFVFLVGRDSLDKTPELVSVSWIQIVVIFHRRGQNGTTLSLESPFLPLPTVKVVISIFFINLIRVGHLEFIIKILEKELQPKTKISKIITTKTHKHTNTPFVLGQQKTGWWFHIFFMFTSIWGNDPVWLIFFRWVETTN